VAVREAYRKRRGLLMTDAQIDRQHDASLCTPQSGAIIAVSLPPGGDINELEFYAVDCR